MWVACRYMATGSAPRGDRIGTARPKEERCNVGSLSLHGDRICTARRQDRDCTTRGGGAASRPDGS
jgi:hypothetical protein